MFIPGYVGRASGNLQQGGELPTKDPNAGFGAGFPQNPQRSPGWNPSNRPSYTPPGRTNSAGMGYAPGNNYTGSPEEWAGGFNNYGAQDGSRMYYNQPADPNAYRYSGGGASKEERGDWLGRQGYDIWTRPWEFDQGTFKNPYMNDQLGMMDARIRDVQGRGDQWGDDQRAFAQTLQDRAMGNGPSVAEQQLQRTTDKNISQQMAMAKSGGNPAAMRGAMYGAGDANQMAAGQGAELRAAEMLKAGEQYGDFMQGARSGDMQMEAQRDDLIRQYTAAGMDAQNAQWAANMELENQRAQQHQQAQATQAGVASSQGPSPWWGLAGAGLSAGGSILGGYAGK